MVIHVNNVVAGVLRMITEHIENTAALLACCRVSQDGWAKVLERTVTDLQDLAAALRAGKIVAHVPTHLVGNAALAAIGSCASSELIRVGLIRGETT